MLKTAEIFLHKRFSQGSSAEMLTFRTLTYSSLLNLREVQWGHHSFNIRVVFVIVNGFIYLDQICRKLDG